MPGLIKPFNGCRDRRRVVQPVSEAEIVKILEIARKRGLAVTPRAAGTSGYGGALPREGGIVLDMSRMAGIVSVDAETKESPSKPERVWRILRKSRQRGVWLSGPILQRPQLDRGWLVGAGRRGLRCLSVWMV